MDVKSKLLFLIQVAQGPLSTDCWIWLGSRNNGGYGYMAYNGWSEGVHRISWIIHRGPIPLGMWICHHCDQPGCLRPDHLFLGTPQDNVADMIAKGRYRAVQQIRLAAERSDG